jgi:hypothetical protein
MKRLVLSAIIVLLAGIPVACGGNREPEVQIELPTTPVLSARSRWGVVISSHLRLREQPTTQSTPVTTLWQGTMLEILSRDERKTMVEGEQNYWYQVVYDGLQGWVFGAYLRLFEEETDAQRAARSLKE